MPIDPVGKKSRPLLRKDIEYAQSNTLSHNAASNFLSVPFSTYKRYAKAYGLYDTDFKNPTGKGITKLRKKGIFGLDEILSGKHPGYDRTLLKERLIMAGYLDGSCRYCGYNKTRPDGRSPLVLTYDDDDKHNLQLDNLSLTCYNCYYLTTGRIKMQNAIIPDVVISPETYQLDNTMTPEEIESMQNDYMIDDMNKNQQRMD